MPICSYQSEIWFDFCKSFDAFIVGSDQKVKGLAAPSNLSMNQTLEGHSGKLLFRGLFIPQGVLFSLLPLFSFFSNFNFVHVINGMYIIDR